MKKIIAILGIIVAPLNSLLNADNRIEIYLKNTPDNIIQTIKNEATTSNLSQMIVGIDTQTPGQISKKMAQYALKKHLTPSLGGIMALYGGYITISDRDGLISFPLRHTTPKLYLALTPNIRLINVKSNTFSHREYINDEQNPIRIYSFELKKDAKQFSYWDVQESKVPDNKKINPLTVVIFINPKHIFIPTGHFLTTDNVQLILPDIFLISRPSSDSALLQTLDIRRYFEPISTEQKKSSDVAIQKMSTNL